MRTLPDSVTARLRGPHAFRPRRLKVSSLREYPALELYVEALLLVWRFAGNFGIRLASQLDFASVLGESKTVPPFARIRMILNQVVTQFEKNFGKKSGGCCQNFLSVAPTAWDILGENFPSWILEMRVALEKLNVTFAGLSSADTAILINYFIDGELEMRYLENQPPNWAGGIAQAIGTVAPADGQDCFSVFSPLCNYGGLLVDLTAEEIMVTASSEVDGAICAIRVFLKAIENRNSIPSFSLYSSREAPQAVSGDNFSLVVAKVGSAERKGDSGMELGKLAELLTVYPNWNHALIATDVNTLKYIREPVQPRLFEDGSIQSLLSGTLDIVIESGHTPSRGPRQAYLVLSRRKRFLPSGIVGVARIHNPRMAMGHESSTSKFSELITSLQAGKGLEWASVRQVRNEVINTVGFGGVSIAYNSLFPNGIAMSTSRPHEGQRIMDMWETDFKQMFPRELGMNRHVRRQSHIVDRLMEGLVEESSGMRESEFCKELRQNLHRCVPFLRRQDRN